MTTDDRNSEAIRAMAAAMEELAAGQVRLGAAAEQLANGQGSMMTAIQELASAQARTDQIVRELAVGLVHIEEVVVELAANQRQLASTQQSIIKVVNQLQVDVATLIDRE